MLHLREIPFDRAICRISEIEFSKEKDYVTTAVKGLKRSDLGEAKKVLALWKIIAENGNLNNVEKLKHLQNDIWELRTPKSRIYCFWENEKSQDHLILTKFYKKSAITKQAAMNDAIRENILIKEEFFRKEDDQ